jgi:hypothetical protein
LFNMSENSRYVIMTFEFEYVKVFHVLFLHVSFDAGVAMIVTASGVIEMY